MPYSLQKEATASLRLRGFVTKCFLIFIVNEVKNFAANIFLKLVSESRTEIRAKELVTYWDLCNKKVGVHILKSLEVSKW